MTSDSSPKYLKGSARIHSREVLHDVVIKLVENAQEHICIFAPRMDKHLFNNRYVKNAFAHFSGGRNRHQARILIVDQKQVFYNNEGFIETCRRFSDSIHIRRASSRSANNHEMYILIDHHCYLKQPDMNNMEAVINCDTTKTVLEMLNKFDAMWQRAEPISISTPGL